ncbi:uncharacterized protein LOC114364078 [Ostrinia furnacalis]|uniref:uncharacterized protein LOC114364078 n=1 Tax=Ostrinia furnacalis TaxID=93504 RepID=UPI00103BDE17|nr:uncharacterized protein LOC114364078 [Ostrinia furnacalis]
MEVFVLLIATLISIITPFNFVDNQKSIHSCEIGDVVQNGRVTCTCTQNYVYECQLKKNPKNQPTKRPAKSACQPNKIYVHESTTCICNYNGTWPHIACADAFSSLPLKDVIKTRCEPDGYAFVGCNVCRCNSKGYIDKSRCTKNECGDKSPERRSSKASNVYGNCEAKNWYSLAPCQFCFCLNENKLVCNTGNYNTKKLQLGTYNLSVCGKDLIKEAIELIPDSDKTLRQGEGTWNVVNKGTSSKPSTIPRPTAVTENSNIVIDVNHENKETFEKPIIRERYDTHNEESSSIESADEKFEYDGKAEGTPQVTQIPFQEDYQLYSKESRQITPEKRENEEEGNDSGNEVDPGLKIPIATQRDKPFEIPPRVSLKNLEDLGQQLKINLPMVLDKVFKLALRKSMVTIGKDDDCTPGSVKTENCNTCFCLKNNKMLCTNNKCD